MASNINATPATSAVAPSRSYASQSSDPFANVVRFRDTMDARSVSPQRPRFDHTATDGDQLQLVEHSGTPREYHSINPPPKLKRRSSSTPARATDVLLRKSAHHDEMAAAGKHGSPLTPQDPERNVKRAAAHEFAKSAFFHGNFTSSHGAMMARHTPRLGPANAAPDLNRAKQRAMLLMPPSMRQRYAGGDQPQNKPPRLLIRSPMLKHQTVSRPTSESRAQLQGLPPLPPSRPNSVEPPGGAMTPMPLSFALPPPARLPSPAVVNRAKSTCRIAIASEEGNSKGKLSEYEEMHMEEDARMEEELEVELDEELISWTDALTELLPLAIPSALSMAMTYGLTTIPLAFIGSYMGEEKLAGASVGSFIICMVAQYPICGLTFALDTLVSHEYGRNPQSDVMGLLLQRGIIVNLLFCIPICLLLANAQPILVSIYGESMALVASDFLRYTPLFLVPLVFFTAFSKFLSNQMLPQIPMIALGFGVVTTPIAQRWLIHLGVEGAMLGMAIAAWIQLFVVIILTMSKKETRATFGALRIGEAMDIEDLSAYLKLALPSALFVAAEASAFDMSVLMAATFGDASGAAWSAILNSCLPFVSLAGGLSTAACAKVGSSLGAGYPSDAKRYAFAAVGAAAVCAVFDGVVIVTFFDFLMHAFGTVGEAAAVGRSMLHIVPIMHFADSVQFAFQGVFSGAGQNHKGALILLSSLWAVGFPASLFLAFFLCMGVKGVVMGLTIGLLVETPAMIYTAYNMDWQALAEAAQAEVLEDEEEDEELEEEDEEDDEDEEMEEITNEPVSARSSVVSRRGRSATPKIVTE